MLGLNRGILQRLGNEPPQDLFLQGLHSTGLKVSVSSDIDGPLAFGLLKALWALDALRVLGRQMLMLLVSVSNQYRIITPSRSEH